MNWDRCRAARALDGLLCSVERSLLSQLGLGDGEDLPRHKPLR